MKDVIGSLLVLIIGGIFLWVGVFRLDEFLKAIKEAKKARIDPFRFINDYWFWKAVFIGIGILIIIISLFSLSN
ncbi:hypothetical protein [Neobacillus cucumis]|uniref:hypothetical protein n=1 Tax=Neobacillus cucumis TaxID=1740721 RepID=UPI0019632901|nr:hypothetical protein [Neobacillus cucumis]MBM7655316.1 hypothetical protein [Neobacillus cucumis]